MKLGTQTGSVFNHLMAVGGQDAPKVGDGATILLWTDRHAATIVAVSKSGKLVGVQRDFAERTDGNGMSDDQGYKYSPNESAPIEEFSLRNNGAWVEVGTKAGRHLSIGHRRSYHDFSF